MQEGGAIVPVFDVLDKRGYPPELTHLGNNVYVYDGKPLDDVTITEIEKIKHVVLVGKY